MKKNNHQFFEANKKLWNDKTPHHIKSEFYDMENFRKGAISLMPTELNELGDVSGKSILHLQCHFGQDTISFSRLGAKATGVDFSNDAIDYANKLANELGEKTKFICANIYDLPQLLDEKFDIIFTSYGAICWLPDLHKWADVISTFLKPGGMFYMVEFHPHIMIYDDNFEKVKYSYFHKNEPIVDEYEGTYADPDAPIKNISYGWNHHISEILNVLINKNLVIEQFNEFPYSHYNCFPNMISDGEKKFVFKNFGNKIPYMFSVKTKKSK